MPTFLSNQSIRSSKDLFNKCHEGYALDYSNEIKSHRYDYDQVPEKGKKIGSVDATSCLGVIYRTLNKLTYVHHHDGRPLESLREVFKEQNFETIGPIKVTLIGGCCYKTPSLCEYSHLEKHTKDNIEQLVKFWNESDFHVDVQGWVIGEGNSYESLCSDFVVDFERTFLLKQGDVGKLNLERGHLIPHYFRRLATVLLDSGNYHFINPYSEKTLEIAPAHLNDNFFAFAKQVMQLNDSSILKACSTTPEIEPPYFPKLIREMARYVMSHKITEHLEILAPPEESVFCLQGELIKTRLATLVT